MKRLTEWAKNGYAYLSGVKDDEQEVKCKSKNTLQCIIDAFNQLAAYEDTNHTPKECAAAFEELERKWISVNEGMPGEHDSMFAKFYRTEKWSDSMFRRLSDEVNICGVYPDGQKFTTTAKTYDGKWSISSVFQMTVTHWMPLPAPAAAGALKEQEG